MKIFLQRNFPDFQYVRLFQTKKNSPCSLGIIMAEVLTVDTPFYELLDYVEVQDVLDAIAGRISIKKLLPQSWNKNIDLVRPTIPDDTDPKFAKVSL